MPVSVVPETGQIVDVDVAAAEAEYEPYREVAVEYWKLTEAPLAPVRSVASLPGMAPKFLKNLVKEVKDLGNDIKGLGDTGPGEPHTYDEKSSNRSGGPRTRSDSLSGTSLRTSRSSGRMP